MVKYRDEGGIRYYDEPYVVEMDKWAKKNVRCVALVRHMNLDEITLENCEIIEIHYQSLSPEYNDKLYALFMPDLFSRRLGVVNGCYSEQSDELRVRVDGV